MEIKIAKEYDEAIKLIAESGKDVRWSFYTLKPNPMMNKLFDYYKPIALVYENDELVYAAHNKTFDGKVLAYDTLDRLVNLSEENNKLIDEKLNSI